MSRGADLSVKFLKLALAAALLAGLASLLNWNEVREALQHLSLEIIVLLLIISGALILISSVKWHYFLKNLGTSPGVTHLSQLYLLGYFVNAFLPSMIGGDVVRSHYAGKQSSTTAALTATVLERYTGFVAMIFLALITMWLSPVATPKLRLTIVALAIGLVLGTCMALWPAPLRWLEGRYPGLRPLKKIDQIRAGLLSAKGDPKLLAVSFGLSLLYHTVTVANVYVAAAAVGWNHPSIIGLFVVLPLILCIGAIPLTPAGLGIQEGAFVFFLGSIGASQEQALLISLILRAKTVLLSLLGGLVWLRVRGTRP